jgi:hypothetical protein
MKILKIEQDTSFEESSIIVTIKEYPRARPVFKLDDLKTNGVLDKKKLEDKLKAWKIIQDEVDAINANPQAKPEPGKPENIDILKALEGTDVK